MLGEMGTEQFAVKTRVDGKLIKEQPIHDPFIHNTVKVCVSRWDLFKALFRKQYEVNVQVSVSGSEGVIRAIMTLDPAEIAHETAIMLEDRRLSRERSAGDNHCSAQEIQ